MFELYDCSCTFSFSEQQQFLEDNDDDYDKNNGISQEDQYPSSLQELLLLGNEPANTLKSESRSPRTSESTDTTCNMASFERSDSDKSLGVHACISADQNDSKDNLPEEDPPELQGVRSSSNTLSRLLRSSSITSTESPHCPICLDPMTPIDHQHPLQCPTRHCHYNFCTSCVQSLLSSSKDDFEMASDGNAHVKIYLHCPNCRADLSTTFRDVLLLRKVDMVHWLLAQRSSQYRELTPSQQRTQAAMQELHVQEAIQAAREKEVIFWKTHHRDSMSFGSNSLLLDDEEDDLSEHKHDDTTGEQLLRQSMHRYESSRRLRDGSFSYEEWGVEADLDNGVHSSFRAHNTQGDDSKTQSSSKKYDNSASSKPASFRKPLDETLLQGLEKCMTHAEQLQVTHWMTSGNPDLLAQAAQTLRKIEEDARHGVMPADRQKVMNRRGSVFEIVEETRQLEENPKPPPGSPRANNGGNVMDSFARRMTPRQRQQLLMKQQRAEHVKLEMAMAARASILERCPLPVRMPKAMVLELNQDPDGRRFPLRFCNDNWDGTVLDAYSKLTVNAVGRRALASSPTGSPWTVTKKAQTSHEGVFHVLSQGQYQRHYGEVQLTKYGETPPRVLVASVQGTAGRQGVMKGDVVTHIDGVALDNDERSVESLVALLRAKRQDGQETVQVVLNGEASIAEALSRRAVVMEEFLND
ncbi:expressed unknown protein [Seminavis robusta]|uniref:RING-type domain-containing protein n=1 Tax=Seminavis robusta TaxID=568900 RepID=A0A9N8ELE9_9STRA|nr:expressed unknown protein [Seminavis robusta]|eukprot:Sro1124_g243850.1 n/a (696) ;mRNA; f:28410-30497